MLLAILGSYLFNNPRPFISDEVTPLFSSGLDNGFPSDHTLLAALLSFAALVYSRRLGVALLILAFIIGWARVAGGVHHGIDVLGSFAIAGVAVLAAKSIMDKQLKKNNSNTCSRTFTTQEKNIALPTHRSVAPRTTSPPRKTPRTLTISPRYPTH